MKHIRKFLLVVLLYLALVLLFYLFDDPVSAEALDQDRLAVITILDGGKQITLSLSEYIPGVLAAEMPADFEPEALKAQAVAARTYILAVTRHNPARVCTDSTCCLAYVPLEEMRSAWGDRFEENCKKIRGAVAATDGQYLAYGSEPIQAVFHASSSGRTENSSALWGDLPYLISVATPETAENVPGLMSSVVLTAEELSTSLGLEPAGEPAQWLEGIRRDDAGRVKALLLCGQAYTGQYLRQALGLRSTDFTLEWNGNAFVFTVRGYGHGVGMSQYGANLLAESGWGYEEILAHYYPETQLVR